MAARTSGEGGVGKAAVGGGDVPDGSRTVGGAEKLGASATRRSGGAGKLGSGGGGLAREGAAAAAEAVGASEGVSVTGAAGENDGERTDPIGRDVVARLKARRVRS